MLMNLRTRQWDDALLHVFGVPRSMLPDIVASSTSRRELRTCSDGPLRASIPITGILGDQQAALVGQTCFNPGECKNTYGTGCFMLVNTGTQIVASKHGLLTTMGYQFGDDAPV